MATFAELLAALETTVLRNKVKIALLITADNIRAEADTVANHTNRLMWAKSALLNPDQYVQPLVNAIVTQNRGLTSAQILGASDAAVQTEVDKAVVTLSAS